MLWRCCDTNGDGKLEYSELLRALDVLDAQEPRSKIDRGQAAQPEATGVTPQKVRSEDKGSRKKGRRKESSPPPSSSSEKKTKKEKKAKKLKEEKDKKQRKKLKNGVHDQSSASA